MPRISAQSLSAQDANQILIDLQTRFAHTLETLAEAQQTSSLFKTIEWERDQGQHGGGMRFSCQDHALFQRASLNHSQVHYDDQPEKSLGSASALSCILHPCSPQAPSLHLHISWTEMKSGSGYWRIMADLNPALPRLDHAQIFRQALIDVFPEYWSEARQQGDRYFEIPALKRRRGVVHYYLENHASDDAKADLNFAKAFGEAVIAVYADLLVDGFKELVSEADQATQLAYHTVYFFQVLTLDRGTTSGLLIHDQNDLGILGSLPARINRPLLASWEAHLPEPQNRLLQSILACLGSEESVEIDEKTKLALAQVLRQHYRAYPEALALQARGNVIPETVGNHRCNNLSSG